MKYDKDKIKQALTLDQIIELVTDLGSSIPIEKDGVLILETICHNTPGEGKHKLYYYDNTKLFRCYTECAEYFDIFQLIVKAKNIQENEEWPLPKAMYYVVQKFHLEGFEENGFEDNENEDWKNIINSQSLVDKIQIKTRETKPIVLETYDGSILNKLSFVPVESWMKEGITIPVMIKYGIKYYPKDCKIVIPHYDESSNLVGIRGRTLIAQEAKIYGKYMPIVINGIMYNHHLSYALYGLNWNKENIRKYKKAIIFEGEKSVMLYESYYGADNNIAVASCGSSISSYQIELLRDLGVDEIIIAYDRQFQEIGDKEFQSHVRNLKLLANKYVNYFTISLLFDKYNKLGYKQSPIDNGKEVFEFLIKNRIVM